MKNQKFLSSYVLVFMCSCILPLSSCQKPAASTHAIKNFPPQMVGTWECRVGTFENQRWEITFNENGGISKLFHYVAGQMDIKDGGIFGTGPDPNTHYIFVFGPVEVGYDPNKDVLQVRIVIDDYEMKLPGGTLNGRLDDRLAGRASEDGLTWEVEWRSYGWLDGAQDPDIDFIDKNPEKIIFQKMVSDQLNNNKKANN